MQEDQNKGSCPDIAVNEQKRKQLYLKENIITKGYDAEDFAMFIEEEREGGTDIKNWTLEELETIVSIYQKSRNIQNEEDMPKDEVFSNPESATLSKLINIKIKF